MSYGQRQHQGTSLITLGVLSPPVFEIPLEQIQVPRGAVQLPKVIMKLPHLEGKQLRPNIQRHQVAWLPTLDRKGFSRALAFTPRTLWWRVLRRIWGGGPPTKATHVPRKVAQG